MKKILSLALLAIGTLTFAQDQAISFDQLPKSGKNFIKSYFGVNKVSAVLLDDDIIKKDYEVVLTNGTKIDFDGSGNWKKVDGKRNEIPTGFAPKNIVKYVNKSFPNTKIVKVEKNRFSYDVELSNGLDLEFNSKGEFKRIDD